MSGMQYLFRFVKYLFTFTDGNITTILMSHWDSGAIGLVFWKKTAMPDMYH